MAKKIKGVLVTSSLKTTGVKVIEDDLHTYYKELECGSIEIPNRKVEGRWFDIICDEEALCKSTPPRPSAITPSGRLALTNNLFVCKGNWETGEQESLSDEECGLILSRIVTTNLKGYKEPVPLLMIDAGQDLYGEEVGLNG